jgi:hypothetical protein
VFNAPALTVEEAGIRVVGLRPQVIPETGALKEAFEAHAKVS